MKHLLLLMLLLTACGKKPEDEYINFSFQIPLQITPHDTVAVGDTLWLTADFSDQLREINSGNTYSVTPQNFELRTDLGLVKLVDKAKPISTQPSATADFSFVNNIGELTNKGTTYSPLSYRYDKGIYRLKIGLIPKRKGVFCVNPITGWDKRSRQQGLPDLSYLVPGRTADGGKRHAVFNAFWFYINEGKTNFDLFKEHCLAVSLNVPTASNIAFEQDGTYTFVVK